MKYTLTIDTGWTWGIVLGCYDDDTPWERLAYWQVDGGADAFIEWFRRIYQPIDSSAVGLFSFDRPGGPASWHWLYIEHADITVISEKFVLLPSPGRTPSTRSLEPLVMEGALKALYEPIVWQRASSQNLTGGKDAKARRKATDQLLKDNGLWLTGKSVGMKDANDVLSATRHALYYMLFDLGHGPTMDKYGKGE